jgi:hypothetical protein
MPETITPHRIAQLITEAPGWARVGLTAPTESMRDAAAETLGRWVWEGLEPSEGAEATKNQMALPLEG